MLRPCRWEINQPTTRVLIVEQVNRSLILTWRTSAVFPCRAATVRVCDPDAIPETPTPLGWVGRKRDMIYFHNSSYQRCPHHGNTHQADCKFILNNSQKCESRNVSRERERERERERNNNKIKRCRSVARQRVSSKNSPKQKTPTDQCWKWRRLPTLSFI